MLSTRSSRQQDVPRTITEALGEELTEPHQTVASYGGCRRPGDAPWPWVKER